MEFDRMEALRIGQALKKIRKQRGLSLAEVEALSEGRWKAVVVGSYERADRAITVGRLGALMALYQTPLSALFPHEEPDSDLGPAVFDLSHRQQLALEHPALGNFLSFIINSRCDWNGHVLTVRSSDLQIAAAYEARTYAEFTEKLRASRFLLQWR